MILHEARIRTASRNLSRTALHPSTAYALAYLINHGDGYLLRSWERLNTDHKQLSTDFHGGGSRMHKESTRGDPAIPSLWPCLIAYAICIPNTAVVTDKTTRSVIRSLGGRGLWLGGKSNHSINQSANQSITQSIHQLNKQSVEIIC